MRIWGIKPLSWSPAIVSDQHDTGRWGSSWTRSDPVIERLKFCKNFQNDYLPKGIVHKKFFRYAGQSNRPWYQLVIRLAIRRPGY